MCYDWDSDGSHDFIGGFTTNLREMCSAQPSREVQNKVKDIYLKCSVAPGIYAPVVQSFPWCQIFEAVTSRIWF